MGYNTAIYLVKRIVVTITLVILMALPTLVSAQQQENLTITVNGVSFKMILVQGGTFTILTFSDMDSDSPTYEVTLSTYYIGETEVTQELWNVVMGSNPSYFKPKETNAARCSYDAFVADVQRLNAKKPDSMHIPTREEWDAAMVTRSGSLKRPVENVSWEDCQEFIRRLNQLTGKKFRLPTEAEWEFAARGGTKSKDYKYSGSNDLNAVAWYDKNAYDKGEGSPDYGTHVVKTKKPNELGIYDMSGNVREWCSDWCGKYKGTAQTNPQGASQGINRVDRGGSWRHVAMFCCSSYRSGFSPDFRDNFLGLRLVLLP